MTFNIGMYSDKLVRKLIEWSCDICANEKLLEVKRREGQLLLDTFCSCALSLHLLCTFFALSLHFISCDECYIVINVWFNYLPVHLWWKLILRRQCMTSTITYLPLHHYVDSLCTAISFELGSTIELKLTKVTFMDY